MPPHYQAAARASLHWRLLCYHFFARLEGQIWRVNSHRIAAARPHHHDELEFNLLIAGHGVYLCEQRTVELTRRTLFWFLPEQQHMLIRYSSDFEMWLAGV